MPIPAFAAVESPLPEVDFDWGERLVPALGEVAALVEIAALDEVAVLVEVAALDEVVLDEVFVLEVAVLDEVAARLVVLEEGSSTAAIEKADDVPQQSVLPPPQQ
jgi:hypothetical protein